MVIKKGYGEKILYLSLCTREWLSDGDSHGKAVLLDLGKLLHS